MKSKSVFVLFIQRHCKLLRLYDVEDGYDYGVLVERCWHRKT